MIPAGIPDGRDEWPPGVLDHLRRFEQGHLVRAVPFFYFTNPSFPVFGQGRTADDGSPELVWDAEDFPYGMIATQTCDLREEAMQCKQCSLTDSAPNQTPSTLCANVWCLSFLSLPKRSTI
jgi:hypothetical protein